MSDKHWIYTSETHSKHALEHEQQRVEDGFSTWDWWSFNDFLYGVIVKGLTRFRNGEGHGYPANLTPEEWNNRLDFMIEWFTKARDDELYVIGSKELTKSNLEQWKKAKHMFADHIDDLWD